MLTNEILDYFKTHRKTIQSQARFIDTKQTLTFELLCGDMSYKRFYRVTANGARFILVVIPTQGDASIEIFSKDNQLAVSPADSFITTARELANHSIHVSPVHAEDKTSGLILLSDHGEYLFEDYVNVHREQPQKLIAYFKKLFEWLQHFQSLPQKLPNDFFALQRTLEKNALFEELTEFTQFGLQAHEQKNLTAIELKRLKDHHEQLATQIAKQPKTLIHRDFQSKNILLNHNDFWIIDYQDLCYGPYSYDYASIIFDPYLNLSLEIQNQLIQLSWEMTFQSHGSFEQFQMELKQCAEQRLLKAAGRYAKQLCLKNKNTHMQYYQSALDKVAELA